VKVPSTGCRSLRFQNLPLIGLSRLSYWRHLAVEPKFILLDGIWHLQITPTYLFTVDGHRLSRFAEDNLKGIKKLEKNNAVLRNVVTWASLLLKLRQHRCPCRQPAPPPTSRGVQQVRNCSTVAPFFARRPSSRRPVVGPGIARAAM
jgi:hypothetical protein